MQGPNLDLLARIFLKSMLKVVNLDGITLHIVDNGMSFEHLTGLGELLAPFPLAVPGIWPKPKLPEVRHGWDNQDISKYAAANTAAVCEWMLTNCGTNKWCMITHFDIQFKRDIIAAMRERLTPQHGLLGSHCPMMMINREAWEQCQVPFRNVDGFVVAPDTLGNPKLRHGSDARRKGGGTPITGFDVAELFEAVLPGYGWTCEAMEDEIASHVHHMRSGSGWMNNTDIDRQVRYSAQQICDKEGF